MRLSRHFKLTLLTILAVSALAFLELERRSSPKTPHRELPRVSPPLVMSVITPQPERGKARSKPTPTSHLSPPCAAQVTLRVGTIDPEFAMSPDSLESALRDAALEWNTATGREWFVVTPSQGVAVNLLFDGRQAELEELKVAERELDEEIARLEGEREERDRESQGLERRMAEFNQERARYEELVAAHNASIALAREAGDVSQDTVASFHEQEQRLSALRERLESASQSLKRGIDEFNQRALATQQGGESLNEKIATLKERFPPRIIREAEHRKGAFVNEINVYTLSNSRDLHYTLLHELGHTLGLSHANEAGAVMSPVRQIGSTVYHLTDLDIAAARALCGEMR